jgi:hypothetical protein
MLYKDPFIIAPQTFQLIQQLQAIDGLKDFYLVGDTALALQLGHRNSIDIDLFTQNDFTAEETADLLDIKFSFTTTLNRKNAVLAVVNKIKTDFIKHNYPLLLKPITEKGITFLSKEDIAAMKIHAIIQSGKRLKDFIDIYFLLQYLTMQQMLGYFEQKYTYSNAMIAVKAVNYFDDIDENIDPPKLLKPLQLQQIKKRVQEATLKPHQLFKAD